MFSTRAEIQTSAEEEGHRVLESLRSEEVHRLEIQISTYKSSLNGIRIFTEGDNEARSTEAGKLQQTELQRPTGKCFHRRIKKTGWGDAHRNSKQIRLSSPWMFFLTSARC